MTDTREKPPTRPSWLSALIFCLLWAVVLNVCAVLYVKNSNFIYYWDNATYWDIARQIAKAGFGADFWKSVYDSTATQDYNYIAGLVSGLSARWFGESRLVYILSIINFYTLPSIWMVYALARRFCPKRPGLSAAAAVLACPVLVFLGLAGFVDMGGLVLCLLCFWLYFVKDPKQQRLWRHLLLGLLLVIMMLYRRYFAFFAVSFVTAMIADCILFSKKKLILLAMLAEMAVILLVFFPGFVFDKLMTDYSSLYAGYKFSFSTDIRLFCRYFGIVLLVLSLAGSIWVFVQKKEQRLVFLWIQLGICFLMFTATQTHGQQHLLLYLPGILVLLLFLLAGITKKALFVLFGLVTVANAVNPLLPRVQPETIRDIAHYALIPDFSLRPRTRTDTEQVLALKQYLNETIGIDKKVGVLSSSFVLNDDILRKCELSLNQPETREDFFAPIPVVDSRDKDLSSLFTVDYMVVAFPAQTHLGEENQRIIVEGVNSFANGTDFARSFAQIGADHFIGELTIRVYKRMGEVSQQDIYAFQSRLFT